MRCLQAAKRAFGDDFTTARVRRMLDADPAIRYYDIRVVTSRGVVELSGFVESAVERARAVALAGHILGVLRVEDLLEIRKIY